MHYYDEDMYFNDPAFPDYVLTVVLTMKNSKRRKRYMDQLRSARPTAHVIVQHNKGFRTTPKPGVGNCGQDLWHANQHAAGLARKYGSRYLLIIEDDCEFLPGFRCNVPGILRHMARHEDTACSYSLGSQPLLGYPVNATTTRIVLGGFTHAVLYNRRALEKFPEIRVKRLHDLELMRPYSPITFYMGSKPSAVQLGLGESTENSDEWNVLNIPYAGYILSGGFYSHVLFYKIQHAFGRVGGVFTVILFIVGLLWCIINLPTFERGRI